MSDSLEKVLEINYTYGYLKQPTEKYPLEGNNIFISHRMGDRDGLLIIKMTRRQKYFAK